MAQASTITAKDNASLLAGNQLQLSTADNERYHFEKSKSSSTFKSKTIEIEQRDTTAQGTTITAGGNVTLKSEGDMVLQGSDIRAGDTLTLDTDGTLALLTATDSHFYRKDEKKSGVMVKMSGNGENSTTERQNQLNAADINISAGQGVLLQVGQREGESLQANLDVLKANPETAWVKQVTAMPGVRLDAVQEAYEQWDYSQQSLSPIAASIIAIVVAAASGGAGAALLGAQTATTTAMANVAFNTLVTQASISTINNGGNLGAVLKEMGSSASLRQLATAVATAGALQGIDSAFGWQSASSTATDPFMQPGAADLMSWETFGRVTSHSALSAGIDSTINGTRFKDALKASLLANIQSEIGQSTADWIGGNGSEWGAGKTLAHGLTSGAIAEITGGKFAAGLAAGAMSELASGLSAGAFKDNKEYQVALNKILGGLAAAAVTGDDSQFDVGAARAETVYRYNNLEHEQIDAWSKEMQTCQDKGGKCDHINEKYEKLAIAQQEKLLSVCATNTEQCKEQYGSVVANSILVKQSIDKALGQDIPWKMAYDLDALWSHQLEAEGAVSNTQFAKELTERYGIETTTATLLAGAVAGAMSGLPAKAPKRAGEVVSPIVPSGGLAAHEAVGGHLIAKHVGQSEAQLLSRLSAEPKITGSSSFYDRAFAEKAISQTLDMKQTEIANWLFGNANRLRLDHTLSNPVGISVTRGASSAVDANSVRVILVRDSKMPTGYKILTGFPTVP